MRVSEWGTFTFRNALTKNKQLRSCGLRFPPICPGRKWHSTSGFPPCSSHLAVPSSRLSVLKLSVPYCPLSGCCLSRRIQTEVQTRVAAFTGSFAFGFCLAHLSALKGYSNYSPQSNEIGAHKMLYLSSKGFNWLLGFFMTYERIQANRFQGYSKVEFSLGRFPSCSPLLCSTVFFYYRWTSEWVILTDFLIQLIEV